MSGILHLKEQLVASISLFKMRVDKTCYYQIMHYSVILTLKIRFHFCLQSTTGEGKESNSSLVTLRFYNLKAFKVLVF